MRISIKPITINLDGKIIASLNRREKDDCVDPVIYWGIYLNNEQISYTSTRELAEKTKLWMEKWLEPSAVNLSSP